MSWALERSNVTVLRSISRAMRRKTADSSASKYRCSCVEHPAISAISALLKSSISTHSTPAKSNIVFPSRRSYADSKSSSTKTTWFPSLNRTITSGDRPQTLTTVPTLPANIRGHSDNFLHRWSMAFVSVTWSPFLNVCLVFTDRIHAARLRCFGSLHPLVPTFDGLVRGPGRW